MTPTREEERAALKKPRKSVADLGPLSYVGTAFIGWIDPIPLHQPVYPFAHLQNAANR